MGPEKGDGFVATGFAGYLRHIDAGFPEGIASFDFLTSVVH
jgi:hypothetical protein